MRMRVLCMLAALLVLAAACGVPSSSKFSPIPLDNIPDGLTETTTTTTIPVTTSTSVTILTTTTIEPVPTTNPTEPVTLYFVYGTQLVPTPQILPRPVQIAVALSALEQGPEGASLGLRTALPSGALFTPTKSRGVLTVDLEKDFFTRMTGLGDERLAIAQIVLTLANLGGVSQVRFTINNEPTPVPLGSGEISTPGQILVVEDYSMLLGNESPATTTTTTTTTTPSVETTTTGG
jgi:hypothetical protein